MKQEPYALIIVTKPFAKISVKNLRNKEEVYYIAEEDGSLIVLLGVYDGKISKSKWKKLYKMSDVIKITRQTKLGEVFKTRRLKFSIRIDEVKI